MTGPGSPLGISTCSATAVICWSISTGLTPVRAQTAAVPNPTAAAPTASDAHRPRTSGMRKNGRAIVGLISAIPSITPLNPSFPTRSSSSADTRNARMTMASCPMSNTVK